MSARAGRGTAQGQRSRDRRAPAERRVAERHGGYFSEENVNTATEHGLDPYIATGRFKHSEPPVPAPRGPIPRTRPPSSGWRARPRRAARIYSRRKAIVEPVFGQIATVQDGRRVRIRGKPAARAQWRLTCAIHNLLKLRRAGGLALVNTS